LRKHAEKVGIPLCTAPAAPKSGLNVLDRPGMQIQTVKDKHGRSVNIYGQCSSSSRTPGHAEAIEALAKKLAESGEYEYVTMQRSWRTATGREGTSSNVPDVIGVRRDGRVDAWEVRSNSQTRGDLLDRLGEGRNTLPPERQGTIDVIEPKPPK